MRHCLELMLAALLALAHPAHAAPAPFEVRFVSVYDGDTFNILVDQLPAPLNKMKVRLRDIDTPERGSKAKCEAEAAAAEEAKLFLQELLKNAKTIAVIDPKWDKYGGRIDGDGQERPGRDETRRCRVSRPRLPVSCPCPFFAGRPCPARPSPCRGP